MWSDHRICVWNAADGSLVHSLTGHDKPVWKLFAPLGSQLSVYLSFQVKGESSIVYMST